MNTRTRRTRSRSLQLSIGIALLALSSTAIGADAPYRGQHDDNAPLRGPRVERNRAPGTGAPFVRGMGDRRAAAPRIPNEVFLRALRALADDDAPENLRLTDEQTQKLRRLAQHHRERTSAFREKNREGLQHLERLRKSPNARQQAQRLAPEQRRRLHELAEATPKTDGVHTRMWSILNDAQREALHERLGQAMRKHRAQREDRSDRAPRAQHQGERRERAERQRNRAERGPRADKAPRAQRHRDRADRQRPDGRRSGTDRRNDGERARAIWSRIQQLPPAARMRLLERLEQGLDRIEANRRRADKPAPSMDDIEVPPADAP